MSLGEQSVRALRQKGAMCLNRAVEAAAQFVARPEVPEHVYHYCSADALRGIMAPVPLSTGETAIGSIFAGSLGRMDDEEEHAYGCTMMSAAIGESADPWITGHRDALIGRIETEGLDRVGSERRFCLSVCEVPNDAKMWKRYAAGGHGFMIEFGLARLRGTERDGLAVDERLVPDLGDARVVPDVYPCLYDRAGQDALCRSLVESVGACMSSPVDREGTGPFSYAHLEDAQASQSVALAVLARFAPIIKVSKWSYQREWRVVTMVPDPQPGALIAHSTHEGKSAEFVRLYQATRVNAPTYEVGKGWVFSPVPRALPITSVTAGARGAQDSDRGWLTELVQPYGPDVEVLGRPNV